MLGVSPSTVRRMYDAYIVTADNRRTKQPRKLSQSDIERLREALELKSAGMEPDDIREALAQTIVPASPELPEASHAAQEGPGSAQAALMVVDAMQSVVAPLEARVMALEAEQRAQAAQRPTWRDVFILVMVAFVLGCILAAGYLWFQ